MMTDRETHIPSILKTFELKLSVQYSTERIFFVAANSLRYS